MHDYTFFLQNKLENKKYKNTTKRLSQKMQCMDGEEEEVSVWKKET